MVSEFRKKKLLYIFNSFFDTDSSGTINKSDFDISLEKISKLQGWSPSDDKYKEVSTYLNNIWTGLQAKADANNDGEVSKEEWIAMWDEFSKDQSAAAEWQKLFCQMVFTVQDKGNDGYVDSEEFAIVHAAFGRNKDEAVQAFQKMSKGKSSISWADFQELFKEYFAAEDVNAPGNYIFGKTSY